MKKIIIVSVFIAVSKLFSQQITISGYIQDAKTGERLPYANVYEPNLKVGTSTNSYGFYSLTFPSNTDSIHLTASYVGYKTWEKTILLKKDIWLTVDLFPVTFTTKEVKVIAEAYDKIEEKSQMSQISIPIKQIENMPAFLGETDVLKTIQLLPGVQSGSEGNSGLYVRGGSPDQNLILLDGTPVYNANHLFGFFSVFNSDAIKNVNLIKGGFPARFGGRLSSVLEINMKEGNNKEFKGQATIGLISSKLTLEAPIIKDKTSFIISGRRTYIDILARPFMPEDNVGGYFFYDLNTKINHTFSKDDRVFLSIYTGNDKFYAESNSNYNEHSSSDIFGLGWGNITSTLRWNHLFSSKLFANTNFTYSNFTFYSDIESKTKNNDKKEEFNVDYSSGIKDFSGSIDFDYLPNPNHYIKFGGNIIHHTFNPGVTQFKISGNTTTNMDTILSQVTSHESLESNVYIEDDFKISNALKINLGIHASLFAIKQKTFSSVEPRISVRYLFNGWSIKSSFAMMTQYIHLLSNSGIGLPTDLWVPTTKRIEPQNGMQGALGFAKSFYYKDELYELSVEGYYKTMSGLIEYKEGSDFLGLKADWQDKVETGEGRSYGAEIFIHKKSGNTTGWLGYTLSWTDRQFDGLNFGKRFPYRYDRRHDIAIALTHSFSNGIDLSAVWVYGTGNAITFGIAKYRTSNSPLEYYYGRFYDLQYDDFEDIIYYGERNSFRMADYHRLDISASFKWGKNDRNKFTIGVYNAYSRKNPFFYYYSHDWEHDGKPVLKQVSLFPILPAISYSYKF